MDYKTVINEFNQIINSDFNIQSFGDIKKTYIYLNRIYRAEMKKIGVDQRKCSNEFEKVIQYVNNCVWNKLKEELKLDDEVINRIFSLIRTIDNIEEIYILNGSVMVKTNKDNESKLVSLPEEDYIDITSDKFTIGKKNNKLIDFVIMSINNSVRSLIQDRLTPDDVLRLSDGKINYAMENINIYLNHNIANILSDSTGLIVTKVIAIYNDELYYLEMKKRADYIILNYIDVNDIELSKMLNKDKKTK